MTLFPPVQDIVGIFEQDTFDQLFVIARPIKAKVTETSTVMTHPVEDGSTITDHKIINPVEIEFNMVVTGPEYLDTFASIKQAFLNSDFLIVQTKSDTYNNMIISSIPHEEDANIFDGFGMVVKLTEVKVVVPQQGESVQDPADPEHTAKQDNGKQQPTESSKSSLLFDIFGG